MGDNENVAVANSAACSECWLSATVLLALAIPASVQAATCGVDPRKADYETPEVQVYERDRDFTLVACRRATGVVRALGSTASGEGTAATDVNAVFGGRWVWSSYLTGDPDSDDEESSSTRDDTLLDLRTGKRVKVPMARVNELIALPGALVTTNANGVMARFPGGRSQTLSTDPAATGLASHGARVYWNVNGVAQSAVLTLPAAERPRPRPTARKIGCRPRPGARLMVRAYRLVVTSAGGQVYACWETTQRRIGAVQDVQIVSNSHVAYRRAGIVGVLDAESGTRTELPGTQGAAAGALLLAAGSGGLSTPTAQLSAEPASEPALAAGRAYWLDGAGMPRTQTSAPS